LPTPFLIRSLTPGGLQNLRLEHPAAGYFLRGSAGEKEGPPYSSLLKLYFIKLGVTSARRFQLGIFFPKGSDQWRKKKLLQNQPLLALKGVIFFTSPTKEKESKEEEYWNDDAYLFDSLSWPCPREDLV